MNIIKTSLTAIWFVALARPVIAVETLGEEGQFVFYSEAFSAGKSLTPGNEGKFEEYLPLHSELSRCDAKPNHFSWVGYNLRKCSNGVHIDTQVNRFVGLYLPTDALSIGGTLEVGMVSRGWKVNGEPFTNGALVFGMGLNVGAVVATEYVGIWPQVSAAYQQVGYNKGVSLRAYLPITVFIKVFYVGLGPEFDYVHAGGITQRLVNFSTTMGVVTD